MNTLNFFLTLDYPTGDPLDNKCGPTQNLECRGADSDQPIEFTRQRDKLLAALAGLDADVIGLNELENTPGVDPLGDPTNGIVAGLNAHARRRAPTTYINTGVIGTDAIRVGLIYKPATVTPVGAFEILDSTDDPRFIDTQEPAGAGADVRRSTRPAPRFTVVGQPPQVQGLATATTSAIPTPATARATATSRARPPPRRWSTGSRPTRPAAATPTS